MCEFHPRGVDPGLTHTHAYFTHEIRVDCRALVYAAYFFSVQFRVPEEVLHARGFVRPHAAILAMAAMPPVLTLPPPPHFLQV